ncbi:MAG: type II toxin-antitoxin system prevent-host-death family antitoxin [Desulfosporosinus sp.]
MKTIPISRARDNIYKIIEETVKFNEPIEITSRKGDVVLISKEEWNSLLETLYLMSIPGLLDSIHEADKVPIEEWGTLVDIGWNLD